MMSVGIAIFLNYKWQYTQPMVIMLFMQPMQMYDNKAIQIHLLGKSGPEYERPWAAAGADNPLAQWAERKKAEAEAAAKKED